MTAGDQFEQIRCVAFDLDDTLFLERDYVRSGFTAVGDWVARNLGLAGFARQAWTLFEGGSRGTIFDEVLAARHVDPTSALIQDLVEIYRRHEPEIELLADASACLAQLHDQVTLAAITDGPVQSQRAKVKALGLDRWMATIICTAELGSGFEKPNPRAFQIVEERTGCHGPQCVYVADNPGKDFPGPSQLGWRTVRISRPAGLHYAVASGPDVNGEVASLGELPQLLGLGQ